MTTDRVGGGGTVSFDPYAERRRMLARQRKGTPLHVDELIAALELMDPGARVEVRHEWGAPFTVTQVREEPGAVVFLIVDGRP
jgi:hypothetical protein